MKQREFEMLQSKLKQTTHGAALEHIERLEQTVIEEQQVTFIYLPSVYKQTSMCHRFNIPFRTDVIWEYSRHV